MKKRLGLVCIELVMMGVAHVYAQPSPLDYSYCGYRQSESVIPDAANVMYVENRGGDNYTRIQKAIDYVSSLKPDKKTGLRGAVLLGEGLFDISEPIRISAKGVVVRGVGRDKTIIRKVGVDRGSAIYLEGENNLKITDTLNITTPYLEVGKRTFAISGGTLNKGEEIMIFRPCTKDWIASLKCNIFGGGIDWLGWKPTDMDANWNRTITAIDGNVITIDAPLTVALDKKWGECKLLRYQWKGRISQSGIENLTIESEYDTKYSKDEDHCWNGVYISNAKDCWVRLVNFRNFAGSAVIVQRTGSQITVEDCISENPVSEIGGFRRRTFYTLGEKCLFQRCYSQKGINDFCAGYCAAGPNAFVQCDTEESLGFSGSISSWATGLLFDIVNIDGNDLKFSNLGQDKFGAGWNTANSTFWQCTAAEIFCSSPAEDAKNYAVGSWAQFEGDGEWSESNNHVQPRSLYYDLLKKRLGRDVDAQGRILPRSTDASSSPSFDEAAKMSQVALTTPRLTLKKWIEDTPFTASVSYRGLIGVDKIYTQKKEAVETEHQYAVKNGKLVMDNILLVGDKHNTPWWSGRLKYNWLPQASYGLTRFVPGREGQGLTDNVDSVVAQMKKEHTLMFSQNYGLWYDLRRNDHERVRRHDGDVWAPFYEQPFARSGEGTAWEGLSKYDLTRLNKWYFYRLKQFAKKGEKEGLLLFNQHYFQHNVLEAGAHWVDCPWRTVNNINNTGFPEPVPFTGDKRVFMAEFFYNENDSVRRKLHRDYIWQTLDQFADNPNVIHSIGEEFTGPLHFVNFWIDCIREWEHKTGKHPLIALSVNKDIQDSVLADKDRAKIIDIIDIEQWFYNNKGLYAPLGGVNMAPRQYMRKIRTGSVRFEDVYRSVIEYTAKYPDKAVVYYAQKYPEMAWAVFMAGGSCAGIPVTDTAFLKDVTGMRPDISGNTKEYYQLDNRNGTVIYKDSSLPVNIDLHKGTYRILKIDPKTGAINTLKNSLQIMSSYQIDGAGVYWFKKL